MNVQFLCAKAWLTNIYPLPSLQGMATYSECTGKIIRAPSLSCIFISSCRIKKNPISSIWRYEQTSFSLLSQAILQKIRQCNLPGVVGIKLTEMITDLKYIFLPYLSHLFELVNYILGFAGIRKGKIFRLGCDTEELQS